MLSLVPPEPIIELVRESRAQFDRHAADGTTPSLEEAMAAFDKLWALNVRIMQQMKEISDEVGALLVDWQRFLPEDEIGRHTTAELMKLME